MVGDRDQAHDLLQQTFIKVFDKLEQFNGEGHPGGWIKRIAVTTTLNHLNRRKLSEEIQEHHLPEEMPEMEEAPQVSATQIHEAIATLPTSARVVVTLHLLENYRHTEIAEMLGITASTSRSQYLRGRLLLQEKIEHTDGKNVMNKFEDHIKNQRPWMDVETPDLDGVWAGVEAQLPNTKPKRGFGWLRAGIAAAVVLTCAVLAHQNTEDQPVAGLPEDTVFPDSYLSEESLLQASFTSLMAEIEAEKDSSIDLGFLETELQEIDRMDAELRESLSQTRDQTKVLQRLLLHYEKKIRILQHMLREVKKRKELQHRTHNDYV